MKSVPFKHHPTRVYGENGPGALENRLGKWPWGTGCTAMRDKMAALPRSHIASKKMRKQKEKLLKFLQSIDS